jgi:sugar lactone lactonase YvrE
VKTVAEGVKPNDLAVTSDGFILFTETGKSQVVRIDPKTGEVTPVDMGITKPNGIALSNDGGTLAVSDYGGTHTWTFRVNPGAVLDAKMPTMPMRLAIDPKGEFRFNEPPPYVTVAKGDGMAVDKRGRYYVTSDLGVQVFDPTGRTDDVHAGRQRPLDPVHRARQKDLPPQADGGKSKAVGSRASSQVRLGSSR